MNLWAAALMVVSLTAGAFHTATAAPDEGCPVILLVRTGGLGAEAKGGLIAAIWESGKIIRAESVDRPWGHHVQGQLASGPLGALLDFVGSDSTWNEPAGEVALDMGDETLTLRWRGKRHSWAETPGVTKTPLVGRFRTKLFALEIERPIRIEPPPSELLICTN